MRESPRAAELSPVVLFLIGLGLLAAVCLVDLVTGGSPAFAFFYLAPVYFVAWNAGAFAGVILAGISFLAMTLYHTGLDPNAATRRLNSPDSVLALIFFVLTALLLAQLHAEYRREHDLSSHDWLTGVFNRREFFHLAEVERLRAIRYARAITIVFIDLDDFKAVNDRFGHAAGDALLTTVARTLRACVRGTDLVSRLGGDEFILMLEETDAEAARSIVTKLRESLADQLAQTSCPVTASMGVITFDAPPASVDAMVHAADELMYAAKNSGGDRAIYRISHYPMSDSEKKVTGA
jgi:diguanylate cyclase (GGDEF)-like protein